MLGHSAERVIVTLGGEGAMALVEGRSMHAPAISTMALDTTGAGDLLVAAYIWADLRGASPEECLQLGRDLRRPLDRHARPASAVRSARRGCSRRARSEGSPRPARPPPEAKREMRGGLERCSTMWG